MKPTGSKWRRTGSPQAMLIDLALVMLHETEKAWLLAETDEGHKKAWVPKSVVQDNEDGTFTMPEFIAIDKGWI